MKVLVMQANDVDRVVEKIHGIMPPFRAILFIFMVSGLFIIRSIKWMVRKYESNINKNFAPGKS